MIPKHRQKAFENLFRLYAVPSTRLHVPARCAPSAAELEKHPQENIDLKGNTGKILFAGQREAEGFAAAVLALSTTDGLEGYPCPRGGHWHVRSISKQAAKRERRKL